MPVWTPRASPRTGTSWASCDDAPWPWLGLAALVAPWSYRNWRHGKVSAQTRAVRTACGAACVQGMWAEAAEADQPRRILLIIHGYPPLYNAGSEVYTQTLARELQHRGHEVLVFCREEDTIAPYFRVRTDFDGDVRPEGFFLASYPNYPKDGLSSHLQGVRLTDVSHFVCC